MKNNSQPRITRRELSKIITKSLDKKGTNVGEAVSDLVTKEFIKAMQYYLQKGYKVEMDDIGDLVPTYRNVRTGNDERDKYSKIKVDMKKDFKEVLNNKLRNSEEYQKNVSKN